MFEVHLYFKTKRSCAWLCGLACLACTEPIKPPRLVPDAEDDAGLDARSEAAAKATREPAELDGPAGCEADPNCAADRPEIRGNGVMKGSSLARSDASGYARSDSRSEIVYMDEAGHVQSLSSRDGDAWLRLDVTAEADAPPPEGAPRAYTRTSGQSAVIYRGENDAIHELSSDAAGGWAFANLTELARGPKAVGDPDGYVRSDDVDAVVYRLPNGHIYELAAMKGAWVGRDLTTLVDAPIAAGDPRAYAQRDGVNSAVYRGAEGHIHDIYANGDGPWYVEDLSEKSNTRAFPAAGDPHPFVRADTVSAIVYRGEDAHVHEIFWQYEPTEAWLHEDLSELVGAPPAAGDPQPLARSDGASSILYRGSDQHLHELTLPEGAISWVHEDVTELSGAPRAAGNPSPYVRADRDNAVAYRSEDGHIYELRRADDGAWQVADLTALASAD